MTHRYLYKGFALFLLLFSSLLQAEVRVSLRAETSTLTIDDQLEITVSVQGERNANRPVCPQSSDYVLQFSGTSSQVQIINGSMSASTDFTYSLQPKREGPIGVGPCQVEVDGKIYSSNSLALQVQKASETRPAERHFFVTGTVNKQDPYLNEQIIYTFRFYSRVHVSQAQFKGPDFNGFTREDLGKQREYQETIDGQLWDVTEVNYALFPTSTGTLQIEPAALTVTVVVQNNNGRRRGGFRGFFDDAFNQKTYNLRTKPLSLAIKPLPPPAAGEAKTLLVGDFTLKAQISPQQAKVGESLTATVVVEGAGNIWDAQVEQPNSQDFKIYADKPQIKSEAQDQQIVGRKEFKFALVPQTAGQKSMPAFSLRYFDAKTQQYRTLHSEEIALSIEEGDEQDKQSLYIGGSPKAEPQQQQREVAVVGNDLMPLKSEANGLQADGVSAGEKRVLLLTLGLCLLSYGGLWFARQRMDQRGDGSVQRRKKAYARFKSSYGLLKNNPRFYEAAAQTLRSYLGDKFSIPGQSLTTVDVVRLLGDKGLDSTILTELRAVLQRCEEGRFGGAVGSATQQDEVANRLVMLVAAIEKHIKV